MDAFYTLLDNHSLDEIFAFCVGLIIFLKMFGEALEWIIRFFRDKFNIRTTTEKKYDEVVENIDSVVKTLEVIEENVDENNKMLAHIGHQVDMLHEQEQQDIKAYIIDRHRHFCYDVGIIDDTSLNDIETRFSYYKSQGGNSYIDGLMSDIRKLKCVPVHQLLRISKTAPEKLGAVMYDDGPQRA